MSEVTALLSALADVLWVGVVGAFLWSVRAEIPGLLRRIRKAKYKDLEVELDQLQQAADSAREMPELPPAVVVEDQKALPPPVAGPGPGAHIADAAPAPSGVLATAVPKYAVVLLAAEIEAELRSYLAATGHLYTRGLVGMSRLEQHGLPQDLATAIARFWQVRSRVVHGLDSTDDDAARAADAGIKILEALRALPRERNVVYQPGVDLFADQEGSHLVANAKGLLLETTSSDGRKRFRIFPTTRDYYVKGLEVAWEWNGRHVWRDTWYRDPDDGKIKLAWNEAMEFVGRPLHVIASPPRENRKRGSE